MVPLIPSDLLKYLQEAFPNRLPENYPNPEQIGLLLGQQNVIRHLVHQYNKQNPLVSGK